MIFFAIRTGLLHCVFFRHMLYFRYPYEMREGMTMEQRFSGQQPLQKTDYIDFGRLQKKYKGNQFWLFLLIFSAMLILMYVAMLFNGSSSPIILLLATLVFAVWVFGGELVGRNAYNAAAQAGLPDHFVFLDTQFQIYAGGRCTAIAYEAVMRLAETDRLFALYVNASTAYLIPKAAFAQQTDELRAFLENATNRKAQRVRSTGKVRFFLLGGLVAAVIVSTILSPSFTGEPEAQPQTLGRGAYSITLPEGFSGLEGDEKAGIFYQITDLNAYITVSFRTDTALMRAGFNPAFGAKNYIRRLLEQISIHPEDITELDDGTACAAYTDTYEDGEFFFYLVCSHENEAFWCTEFYCSAADRAKYEPLFAEWAATIRITPQADN